MKITITVEYTGAFEQDEEITSTATTFEQAEMELGRMERYLNKLEAQAETAEAMIDDIR